MLSRSTCFFPVLAISVVSATSSTAIAEPTAATEASGSNGLEEIVDTARRKAERIEKVPAAITAFSANDLQERQIHTEEDLQHSVPGLTIREALSSNQINYSIRGQTIDPYTTSPPGVLPYIDDVQVSYTSASSFYDLQSVQVLKGPQGTLFGRNTTGGAVLFTTAKPTDDFSGSGTLRLGNYSDTEFEGWVNVPVIADKLLIRASGDFVQRDGYVHNISTTPTAGERDLGAVDYQSGRISILFRPTDDIENETVFQYNQQGGTNLSGPIYSVYACGTPGLNTSVDCLYNPKLDPALFSAYIAAHPWAYPGGITAYLGVQKARGPYTVEYDGPSFFTANDAWVANTTTYTIDSDTLLKNIFGWTKSTSKYSVDTDGSPYSIFNYGPFDATVGQFIWTHDWSEELQLQGKTLGGNLDYILGGYYSYQEFKTYFQENYFELAPLFVLPPAVDDNQQTSDTEAFFAQGTYDLGPVTGVDGLKVTGGFRYTWEQVYAAEGSKSTFVGPHLSENFDDPSWTVGIDYQMTPDLLLYVTHRGSWRSGGFNSYQPPHQGTAAEGGSLFLPETTKDVEVGAKYNGSIGGHSVRLNADFYNQWVDDVQRVVYATPPGGGPQAFTVNVPSAEVTGVELDGQFNATDWLSVGASVSYADARFTGNAAAIVFGNTTAFGPYADTPRWSGDVFAEFTLPVAADLGQVTLRGDYYAQTKFYFSSTNNSVSPGTELPFYGIANFRVDWANIAGSDFSAAFFMNNAFDRTYYVGGLPVGSSFGLNTAIPGRPRMFGGEIRYQF